MSIRILKNGVLDTIQDLGRNGYGHLGINPGGAMDRVAMQVANVLVGNDPATAVIEMHLPAAEMLFEADAMIALSGAPAHARVNGEEVPVLHPILVKKNATLVFGKRESGARIYMAVKGGFALEEWLHSFSTHTKAAAGGFKGRALQKGDRLSCKESNSFVWEEQQYVKVLPWFARVSDLYQQHQLRFIPGEAYFLLTDATKQQLGKMPCTISRDSDRMGFRLQAETVQLPGPKELISTGVTRGTIQLLPEGQMIILMADHQTTGGYPVVGHIISADSPSLAQWQPGESFFLQKTTLAVAEMALYEQYRQLLQLQYACNFRLRDYR